MGIRSFKLLILWKRFCAVTMCGVSIFGLVFWLSIGYAAISPDSSDNHKWIEEIEEVFLPSAHCKQCHYRHYEEWKGMREQTPDLKTFGRVDGALLHGTALTSPVFKTILGLWLQTNPSADEKPRC